MYSLNGTHLDVSLGYSSWYSIAPFLELFTRVIWIFVLGLQSRADQRSLLCMRKLSPTRLSYQVCCYYLFIFSPWIRRIYLFLLCVTLRDVKVSYSCWWLHLRHHVLFYTIFSHILSAWVLWYWKVYTNNRNQAYILMIPKNESVLSPLHALQKSFFDPFEDAALCSIADNQEEFNYTSCQFILTPFTSSMVHVIMDQSILHGEKKSKCTQYKAQSSILQRFHQKPSE